MLSILIPDEKGLNPVGVAAGDLVLKELELHLGEVHTIRGAGVSGILDKRGAFSCDMIMTLQRRDAGVGRSWGRSFFDAWAALKRLPVIELPDSLEQDLEQGLGQAEPTGSTTTPKHNSSQRPRRMNLFTFLRRGHRYFFHPGFLSVMEAEKTGGSEDFEIAGKIELETSGLGGVFKEWDGKRQLMGVFLGPTSPKAVDPDELPRWLAFLARACDRLIYEDKSQVVLFYQGEEGRKSARVFEGFCRIKPLLIHVDPLAFSKRVKLFQLCKSVVVTGRAGEIISVASGVPPVVYGYESQLSFPGEGVLSWPRSAGRDLVHVLRAVGADLELREEILSELQRERGETKVEMRRWVRRLLVREGFGAALVNG